MKRTLYIHIGNHRTATTSIQNFMWRNFDRLVDQGYLYPFRVRRHFELVGRLLGKGDVSAIARDLDERAGSKTPESHSIVISDEDICMRNDLRRLAGLKDHFDVKIIYSIRRQDLWLESWYFQNIKWQWNPDLSHITFDKFLKDRGQFHWLHYDAYVRMLEKIFGADNILLSVFEKNQMPDGPVLKFCEQIGLTELDGFTDPPHVNSSLSAEMVEFMRHLPLDTIPEPERHLLRATFEQVDRKALGNKGKQSERMMPADQRGEILGDFAKGNTALAQRYFDRDDLFLEPLPDADTPLAQMQIPQDSETLITRLVAPFLQQLVANGSLAAPAPKKPAPKKPAPKKQANKPQAQKKSAAKAVKTSPKKAPK